MQSKKHIKITMHASEIRTHLQIGKGNNSAESNSIQPKKFKNCNASSNLSFSGPACIGMQKAVE